jgi:predicted SnoaL-like aldol condensation-catalyzing enzyme
MKLSRRRGMVRVGTLMACLAMVCGASSLAAEPTLQEKNRKLVIEMWQAVIVELDENAVSRYIAKDYIQHNPNIAQGREGLIAAIRRTRAPGGKRHSVKRLIASFAEGDLVVLVWDRDLPDPSRPGQIYTNNAFDMFRVKDGMIVEHWDDNHKNP